MGFVRARADRIRRHREKTSEPSYRCRERTCGRCLRIFHRRHRQRNVGRRQLDLDLRQGRRAHRERHQDGGSRELPCLLQGRGTGAKGGPTITKWTYAWSANGNLTEVRHYNSAGNLVLTVDYSYDAFGEMIQKNDGTVLSRFCQDGWNANMFPSPLAGEGSGVRGRSATRP